MLDPLQKLKIRLMAEGISIQPAARAAIGDAGAPITLAEYASTSGIGLRLHPNTWVNAPIRDFNANFVESPTAALEYVGGHFVVRAGTLEVTATPVPVPDYHDQCNSSGEAYVSYGVTHTDRVRVSPIGGCAVACHFCDLPYEVRYHRKSIPGLVETIRIALTDARLPARHVLISGGTPKPADYSYENDVYEAVCGAFPTVDVDVMMMPMPGLLDPARLNRVGVHALYANMELYNESFARHVMPAKADIGRDRYFDFIEKAVAELGVGRVRSLLLVGLESVEDTLLGVEALARRGCEPVLSPFRPDPATPLTHHLPPSADTLENAYLRSAEIVARYGVHLGPPCVPCHHNTLTFPDESECLDDLPA